ncbi:winged helix-turn-helix transcriptional regulator [Candidatus Parcubacteria bacterium]|nr:winged helix-turn-helix transcriptional regulator [Patescibacteria group bacterium]MCG2688670.1 winged helix-turn-helix transcriptional regulator [Candidatus Parcubacteria bacterium]
MKNKKLHPTQKKLLDILIKNTDDDLSIRDMQEMLDISSTSVVAHHLKQLEKNGYLKKNPYNPKDYQVVKGSPEKQITYLNLYGLAHCGPRGSILDGNPTDRIAISTKLLTFPSSEAFVVKAKGDSMAPKINEGDFVIVKRNRNPASETIVACVNDGEALIKKIRIEKDKNRKRYILISLNPKYPPFLAKDDFRIEGEVRGIISSKFD